MAEFVFTIGKPFMFAAHALREGIYYIHNEWCGHVIQAPISIIIAIKQTLAPKLELCVVRVTPSFTQNEMITKKEEIGKYLLG